ncbi:MAG: hypothetical protein RIC35_13585 [Marinoscillum sp.]
MMAEIIGYLAIALGLIAIANKNMVKLRIIHGLSAATYICYGVMIEAYPIAFGGVIFMGIHTYHLIKIKRKSTV